MDEKITIPEQTYIVVMTLTTLYAMRDAMRNIAPELVGISAEEFSLVRQHLVKWSDDLQARIDLQLEKSETT